MPYRNGKFVHPDQLPSNERDDWNERHPHPSSWDYVAKQKREANAKECEWMSDPEEVRKHNARVEEAKRQREAEEGIDDE
jgi:hypothetical protein